MPLTAVKKHKMKVGAVVGTVLGLFVFFVAWAASNNLASAFIIPAGTIIGAAQGYLSPEFDDD